MTGEATAAESRRLRLALTLAAVIELLSGLSSLPVLFVDPYEVPGPGAGGAIIAAYILVHPIAAFLALLYAIRGAVPNALVAMGVLILLTWANYLPSVALHGLDWGGLGTAFTIYQIFLAPLLGLAVIGLALARTRLTLAMLLAVIPTAVGVLSVIAFSIGVMIYGF